MAPAYAGFTRHLSASPVGEHCGVSAVPDELQLLDLLTAVQNGSYVEKAVPVATLAAQGYVLTVDGSHCLSMLGLETVWELRKRALGQSTGESG